MREQVFHKTVEINSVLSCQIKSKQNNALFTYEDVTLGAVAWLYINIHKNIYN